MTTIGRYEIRGELGRGGMATVLRAYDPMFKRDVAVKVLPREFLHDPAFRARFEREAQVVAALEHSAIVPVYDYGENAETGQPFIVMRLMSGGTLAEKLRGQPMDLNEVARILSRLAPALDFAHARGVVHRDLKPGNILFDGEGNPYISDFGLAKLAESNVNLTGTGLMGTPAYMSPEQARGEKEIDGRSDLYALGAIVYQMLTGRQPYEAPTPIAVVLKHVNEPPPSLRAVRPDLPVNAEAIIHKAMAKDPTTRYPTAASLSNDLSALTTNTAAALGSAVGSGAWSMPAPVGDSRTVAVPLNPASSPPSSGSGSIAPAPRSGIAGCSTGLIAGVAVAGVLVIAAALCIAGVINLGPLSALAGLATPTPSATEPPPTVPPATETIIPPTRTRRPTRTPLPTRTPGATSTSAPDGQALVRDDFSSDTGVWSVGDYSDSAFAITGGAYIVTVKDKNLIAWGNYEPQTYANVSISTQATDLSDLPQSSKNWPGFGLICGYVDNNNFYYAGVTADGYYVVNKYQNGNTIGLSSSDGKWATTNDIVPFQKSYNVKLVCADGYLSLYVDDKRLAYVADSDLGEGLLGIFVNSFDAGGVSVSFDNVIIESARDSVNDLRQTAPKDLDLEKTLTQLGQSLPAVLESLPELSRSLPQLTRLAARLNEPETSAAIDTVLDNAAVLALAAQSADGLLKRSDVIIENVAGSVRDVVGSDSAANVATFEQSLQVLAQLRDALPTLVQILPRLTRSLPSLLDVAERLEVILGSQEFGALMSSGVFAPKTVGIVGEAGKAVVEVYDEQMAKATPAGRMDLFRALGDPDVQRALGFMIEFAKRFGKHFR